MKIDDVQTSGQPLVLAVSEDVDALVTRLWITLPAGYREYVTRLGEGVFATLVRIYPPWRIDKELTEWRRRIGKYWFWDEGCELLPKERALECIIIGDTVNGDELVFHPGRVDKLFVLPRELEMIYEAGKDLLSAVDWICNSGILTESVNSRDFEPFDSRIEAGEGAGPAVDADGESLDDIINVAKTWADRHEVRKMAKKELEAHVGKNRKAEILHESFVLDGGPFEMPGQ